MKLRHTLIYNLGAGSAQLNSLYCCLQPNATFGVCSTPKPATAPGSSPTGTVAHESSAYSCIKSLTWWWLLLRTMSMAILLL